ncbi:MAG: S-methyl-5-thioribose-1-phosphate isomerase [Acidimicrobiales bacterium]|jgi:methylthioribose-1-phosphate isomerase|nr:S-methyl-5-thioribose-1-phosphate isomerase [Acidimicrobiales bacterium]MDP6902181.1 S-methyl-5-thioribose-1-phosphate isomerase [Acidimicrobiales bacterium]HJL99521.1 S-methyl-5-thioribose-1-phosphate isomerase [Acidimicrobiales bacterium]
MKRPTPPIEWADDHIRIIDQTLLPAEVKIVEIRNAAQAVDAIQRLAIRGAPALGAFGSLALVVALDEIQPRSLSEAHGRLEECRTLIGDARPTAVNLRWAVDRVIDQATNNADDLPALRAALIREAQAVAAEDEAACNEIGRLGHELLRDANVIGTHCNAGRLATAGTGTALAPMYAKAEAGEPLRVLASETRPLFQGARLTAWELNDAGIDVTVVPDGAMASTVLSGQVDAYIVGADRIAANGDAANKIGTVGHALAAREAEIPFYVAAPTSTIDISLATGNHIEIEQRDAIEVHEIRGSRLTPEGVAASNPAFDVTPNHLITAIITEAGVLRAPFKDSIAEALSRVGRS